MLGVLLHLSISTHPLKSTTQILKMADFNDNNMPNDGNDGNNGNDDNVVADVNNDVNDLPDLTENEIENVRLFALDQLNNRTRHEVNRAIYDNFNIDGRLTFGNASRIDDELFGYDENAFWCEAYGFPDEGQHIDLNGDVFVATNVGVFTFSLVPDDNNVDE